MPPAASRRGRPPEELTDTAVTQELCQRLRQLRRERHWSLDQLSQSSGVSRSMLSQIERNRANPTLAVAYRIARALGMSLAELVDPGGAPRRIEVIRSHDGSHTYRSDEKGTIRTLSPLHLEKDVEFYEVRLRSGGALRSAAHYQGTREFLTVQKGRIQVESADHRETLTVGDSASYRADVPHALINLGKSETVVFLVVIYQ